jgi:Na+/H+-translocating membrane pyrophosphatase
MITKKKFSKATSIVFVALLILATMMLFFELRNSSGNDAAGKGLALLILPMVYIPFAIVAAILTIINYKILKKKDTIKNKSLRKPTSFILPFLLFFLVTLISVKGDIFVVFKAMFSSIFFLFFLSIPILGFVMCKIYSWLTPMEDRSEEDTLKNKKITKIAIIVFVLLALILLFTLSSN